MPEKPQLRVLVAVALVTACTLALQVMLTRLFSAALAYHFSFVAISLAPLGTGAGALLVYLVPRWFERLPLERLLFVGFPTYALSVVLFALLIFTGIGSGISARFTRTREALLIALGVLIA